MAETALKSVVDAEAAFARPLLRILILEDEVHCVRLFSECLATYEDALFTCAITARLSEAIALLQRDTFDAALLDLNVEDSQGWHTFASFQEAARGMPMIIVTGESDPQLATRCVRAGAQDFLFKDKHLAGVLPRALQHAIDREAARNELQSALYRLQQRERDLEANLENLRRTQTSLAELEKQRTTALLVLGLAHELKNPLQILRMGLDYLDHHKAMVEPLRTVTGDLKGAVARADRLVVDLLHYGAPRPLELAACSFNRVIETAVQLLRTMAEAKCVAVDLHLDPDLPDMDLDAGKMEQALLNLIMNGIQASPRHGRIVVRSGVRSLRAFLGEAGRASETNHDGQVLLVEILDHGPGIAPEHLPHLFDPFFTSGKGGHGIGLGLAVTRMIVELHGGSMALENRPEGGACARLHFIL